jgi:hypothetical protein
MNEVGICPSCGGLIAMKEIKTDGEYVKFHYMGTLNFRCNECLKADNNGIIGCISQE